MNMTDSIIDKILYKEFTTENVGQSISIDLPFFDDSDSIIEDEEMYITNVEDGEKTLCEFLPKIGGELKISIRAHLSPSAQTVRVYVGDDKVLEEYNNNSTIEKILTFPAFSKIKVTSEAIGGTAKILFVRLTGYIRDKQDMYITIESEK